MYSASLTYDAMLPRFSFDDHWPFEMPEASRCGFPRILKAKSDVFFNFHVNAEDINEAI